MQWIVTNYGVTRGLASEGGGKTVATSSSSASPATDADAGVSVPPGNATPPSPTVLNKFRCSRLFLQVGAINAANLNGTLVTPPSAAAQVKAVNERMTALHCQDFFAV